MVKLQTAPILVLLFSLAMDSGLVFLLFYCILNHNFYLETTISMARSTLP